MRCQTRSTSILIVLCLLDGGSALAQVERSGGGDNKIMQQYQQLSAERVQLQAENARLKQELDAAKGQLGGLQKERDALKSRVGGAEALAAQARNSSQGIEQSLEQTKQRLNELVGRFRETATQLRDIEADRNQARAELQARNRAFDVCAESNLQLFEISREVLDRYEGQGMFSSLARAEPFTQLKRTQIENLVDEYRQRAEELRVQQRAANDARPAQKAP